MGFYPGNRNKKKYRENAKPYDSSPKKNQKMSQKKNLSCNVSKYDES